MIGDRLVGDKRWAIGDRWWAIGDRAIGGGRWVIGRAVAYNRHEFILDSIFVARVVVAANACSGGGMGH